MSKIVQILVSGNVQGVGYRMFVVAHAEALGLRGWVRNLRDGRVEILTEVAEDSLENLRVQLKQGPRRSHVDELEVRPVNFEINGDGFKVIEDGGKPWSQNS